MLVPYDGRVVPLEEALDCLMKEMQAKLTEGVHLEIRELFDAARADEEDFQDKVEFTDDVHSFILRLIRLVSELVDTAKEIQGSPPKECKEWWAARKATRKTQLAAATAEKKSNLLKQRKKSKFDLPR